MKDATAIDIEHYAWRAPAVVEGEKRLLTPQSDPYEYEYPFDGIFASTEEAMTALHDQEMVEEAVEGNWVLLHFTATPVGNANGDQWEAT